MHFLIMMTDLPLSTCNLHPSLSAGQDWDKMLPAGVGKRKEVRQVQPVTLAPALRAEHLSQPGRGKPDQSLIHLFNTIDRVHCAR